VIRPWHRKGRWSPEEAAAELHRRRVELIGQLRRRSEGRGIPAGAQEEIVDDAITAVVMAPRGVANEHHLLGAFWLAVDHRCRRHREGRHLTRLGSRRRVAFDLATQQTLVADNPFDALELRERLARAADLIADLNTRERAAEWGPSQPPACWDFRSARCAPQLVALTPSLIASPRFTPPGGCVSSAPALSPLTPRAGQASGRCGSREPT